MKRLMLCAAAIVFAQAMVWAEAEVGKPAPPFELTDGSGKTHKLADYKGKILVLENYNLDCPFVVNHYKSGAMQEVQGESTAKGVVWLVVNSSYADAGRTKKEQTEQKLKASAVLHDPKGKIGKAYGFKTTPHMIVIDQQGRVAYNGAIDDKNSTDHDPRKARNYVREAVQKLAAGQAVTVASTKPYGCGAKYAQ